MANLNYSSGSASSSNQSARQINLPTLKTLSSVTTYPFVDTHTHLHYVLEHLQHPPSSLTSYKSLRELHFPPNLEFCINVLCDPESLASDILFPDSFLDWRVQAKESYIYLAVGIHPHHAKIYDDHIEQQMLKILEHPKTIALGEIGLDYHYNNSPRDIQKLIFARQLKKAVELRKPIVVHTREAEQDTYDLLTTYVPYNWHIHVHCFTDSPEFARNLCDYFTNLYIGITGVITFGTAKNTQAVITEVVPMNRFLLETDAPYMVPAKLNKRRRTHDKISVSHSGMIPFVAEKIAELKGIEIDQVMNAARENTRNMYGI
ncbi:hypothetical protein G9A89_017932 [Geosiphon pyriformis]|nr:hypothetical protein G9A89_017932 [Geosiphon pyriformis]